MTLEKDQPKPPTTRLQKIVWIVTLTVAISLAVVAIILGIVFHVNIFGR
jgi:type IV secretory pathway VirB2 component (pilin)